MTDTAPQNPQGNPIAAAPLSAGAKMGIGAGLLFLVLAAILLIPGPGLAGGGAVFGYIILICIPVCMILFFFFLQGRHIAIIVSSLFAAAILCTLIMLIKVGSAVQGTLDQAKVISEISYDKNGNLQLPAGIDQNGPIAQSVSKYAREMSAIQTGFKLDMEASGMTSLFDAQALSGNDAILRDCGRVIALGPKIEKYRKDAVTATDMLRRDVGRADVDDAVRKGMLEGIGTSTEAMVRLDKMWELQSKMVTESHGVCMILSKRNWKVQGGVFNFTSRSDMNSFKDRIARIDGYNQQITAMQKAGAAESRLNEDQVGAALNP
jgi:hypothetical protein